MSLEPGLTDLVADLYDWMSMRACPICRSATGEACRALSGRVAGGRPDGKAVKLTRPHAARKRRKVRCAKLRETNAGVDTNAQ